MTRILLSVLWLCLCAACVQGAHPGPEKPASFYLKLIQSPDNHVFAHNKHKSRRIKGTVVVRNRTTGDTTHVTVELEPGILVSLGPVAPNGTVLEFTIEAPEYTSPAETGTPGIEQLTIERGERCPEANRGRQVWLVNQNRTYSILAVVEIEGLATGTARTVERLVPPGGRIMVDCEVVLRDGSLTESEEASFHIKGARVLQ